MPYRVQLPFNDDIKALVQCAVQIPIVKFQSGATLPQLTDTHFHALQYGVLDIFHSLSHRYLELQDFRLSGPFK